MICLCAVLCLTGCGTNENKNLDNTNNNESNINNENIQSSYTMEKIVVGKYSFMMPDNADTKFADGETYQNFYSSDGETGTVFYSIDGPLSIPKDEDSAHDITSSLGKIVDFKYDNGKDVEQAFVINKYEDEYQGVRLVSNKNDLKDCIWLSVTGTDKKIIEKILNSLEW